MKRTERVAAIVAMLQNAPNKVFSLQYFCDLYDAAKSSISEDIQAANIAVKETGFGYLDTVTGARGGVKYVPYLSDEKTAEFQKEFAKKLNNPDRLLGGNFIYTSDLFYNPDIVKLMATIFARKFEKLDCDYVVTLETKGIPLAFSVANLLNLPLVVVRREAKISEGSTVSINYFSGSDDRIQKMSMAKRAIQAGSKVLIIDDFMRGGGSLVGVTQMINEFNSEVVGIGVAISSLKPEKKKVTNYTCIAYLGDISYENKTIEVIPNEHIY